MTKAILTRAAVLLLMAAVPALAEDVPGDVDAGEKVFKKCMACHAVGATAEDKTGPVLNGVVGRHAAGHEGFAYSDAMKQKGTEGLVWTPENLHAFLAKPKDFVPGTKMTFAGLKKEEDITNVIAFLASHQ